jgi:uncharacterized protein
MRATLTALFFALAAPAFADPAPIIDMHLHAHPLRFYGNPPPKVCVNNEPLHWPAGDMANVDIPALFGCDHPIAAPATDIQVLSQTLEILKRRNIYAVASGPLDEVTKWRAAAPDRILPAISFLPGDEADPALVAQLRKWHKEGKFAVFAEVGAQYRGLSPDDPSLEPFWALAEELDIPVGIHMGVGPPGAPFWSDPKYRNRLGNPLLLEDMLVRHPKLRLYVMHAGWPMTDEMIYLMFTYPQVYVDISCDNWNQPRPEFYRELRRLIEAGYGKRVMFGSDQMVWPQTLEAAIDTIEDADFLNPEQKRDIFYNNAARFLRLDGKAFVVK